MGGGGYGGRWEGGNEVSSNHSKHALNCVPKEVCVNLNEPKAPTLCSLGYHVPRP